MTRSDSDERAAETRRRLALVRAAIDRAARDNGRDAAGITLVAVSKTFPGVDILPALGAGQMVYGENYVQEAKAKWPELKQGHGPVELHCIGPLQSNKARDAVELFDVIETLDRASLAQALARELARMQGRRQLRLFVQVNTGEEPQKGGVVPGEADAFLDLCRNRHGLVIEGLMCIPPADEPPSPHFALLAKIARRNGLQSLSMGMSADFEQAIALGATHVRVGSAIFGERPLLPTPPTPVP